MGELQVCTECRHPLLGSPVRPLGQEQTALWPTTLHRALGPQVLAESQGLAHWLLMQARLAGQFELERQPKMQVTPWQISWLLQSSSLRHSGLQIPLSHTSLTRQVLSLKQTSLQNLPLQTCLSGHWVLAEQDWGCLTQPTTGVGLGMKPEGQEHWALWFTTWQLAFGPQESPRQGSVQRLLMQVFDSGQSLLARQPTIHILLRQTWPRKQSLSTRHVTEKWKDENSRRVFPSRDMITKGKWRMLRAETLHALIAQGRRG